MSHNLNSLKGVISEIIEANIIEDIDGDTRSLDNGSSRSFFSGVSHLMSLGISSA